MQLEEAFWKEAVELHITLSISNTFYALIHHQLFLVMDK